MYLLDGCNFPMFDYLNNFRAKISEFLIAKNSLIGFMNTVLYRVIYFPHLQFSDETYACLHM